MKQRIGQPICGVYVRAVRAVRAPFLAVRAVSGPCPGCPGSNHYSDARVFREGPKHWHAPDRTTDTLTLSQFSAEFGVDLSPGLTPKKVSDSFATAEKAEQIAPSRGRDSAAVFWGIS